MNSSPAIQFEEFAQHTTFSGEKDNYMLTARDHPEFGIWEQRTIDLEFIKVTENKACLNRTLNVKIYDENLTDQVNHCMCVDGSLGAHFGQYKLAAELSPGYYHYIKVQASEYSLAMSKSFHNVHIQINRKHYSSLLCDDEAWSAALKENILHDDICYPGEFSLTPAMFKTIFDIFSSPLSGSLKKLLMEAKVLELIALQLNTSLIGPDGKKTSRRSTDLLHAIKDHLDKTFLEEHSLRSICQEFGINEFALKNGFKKVFGITVFDFILSRRLEYARDLLLNTDCTIQEAGSKAGYKYPNHFSTAFKNKFGISPGKLVVMS